HISRPYGAYSRRVFLVRSQNGRHPATFHLGRLIDLRDILKLFDKPAKQIHPLILVDDVAPSKLHPCLYLVTLGEEFTGMPCLEVEVVLVGVRSKPNLLELHRLRLLPGFLFLLLLLVSVFAVVDDLNDRGLSHWGDLDQIQPEFASAPERL